MTQHQQNYANYFQKRLNFTRMRTDPWARVQQTQLHHAATSTEPTFPKLIFQGSSAS